MDVGRNARFQVLYREVNDCTLQISRELSDEPLATLSILCECGQDCTDPIDVAVDEYERVRQEPTQFFVRVGHEVPAVEETASRQDGWMVVANIGLAGEIAKNAYEARGSRLWPPKPTD